MSKKIFNFSNKDGLLKAIKDAVAENNSKKMAVLGTVSELMFEDPHDLAINLLSLVSKARFDSRDEFAEYLYHVCDEKELKTFTIWLADLAAKKEKKETKDSE